MRTREVRLAAAASALAILLAAAGAARITSRISAAGAPAARSRAAAPGAAGEDGGRSGRELFELHCGRCHEPAGLAPELHGEAPGTAVLDLLELLDDHGAADAMEDRAIARALLEAGR